MRKCEPKVSIVIPAYNAANYLVQAIDSALSQTYNNVEIVVVNDGSKDGGETERIAKMYGERIVYISKENGGSSSALNCGIRAMSGEWFSWLSHDDLYYPNKIEDQITLINDLLENGLDSSQLNKHVFFGAADLINGEGKYIRRESTQRINKTNKKINCSEGSLNLIAIPTQDGFHGCSCLVHKSAFEEIGFFDERLRLLNDMDFWFRLYTNNYVIHFVPKVLVCGRVHANQVSRSIGFSYHNAEQDMFWGRSLQWLTANCSKNYDLFYKFGKTAILKTRFEEGKQAFLIATSLKSNKKIIIWCKKNIFMLYARCKEIAKRIYLLLR